MNDAKTMGASGLETERPRLPLGLWVLIFTETWERFSHYGMRALLILYLTAPLAMGGLGLGDKRASAIFGGYLLAIYLFGLSGGQIADKFLGAKRTIVFGGFFIAAGQLLLQVRNLNGLIASLVLIAVGTCLMKPNISASVGRLFTKEDTRRDRAFTYEYMGINVGATIAPFICGYLAKNMGFLEFLHKFGLDSKSGWAWAFGVSGAGMLMGLLNFVLRRKHVRDVSLAEGQTEPAPKSHGFVALLVLVLLALAWMVIASPSWPIQLLVGAVASAGAMSGVQYLIKKGYVQARTPAVTATGEEEHHHLSKEDWNRILVVVMMLCFSATFWFVFQQAGSTFTLFAERYTNRMIGSFEIPAPWFQAVNALFIVALGPIFAWIWAKRTGRWPSSPVKFALGLFFVSLGAMVLVPASRIVQGTPGVVTQVGMGWLIGVYFIHTIGELCLSPVGLSYVSRLAPKAISSQLMGAWFFATGIGSFLAGKAAGLMTTMPLAHLYGMSALIALGASFLLWFVVSRVIHKLMGGYS